jgi:hypothetical protein
MPSNANPFCEIADDGIPLIELKQGIVLYLEQPPSPSKARLVYDLYLKHCGDRINVYRSTSLSAPLKKWSRNAQYTFENHELPNLRQRDHWGYMFSDNQTTDSYMFMFHGYRPHSEAGTASFYRFDFDWQVDLQFFIDFVQELISLVPCLSGFGGYYLQGRPAYKTESFNRIYALARRYWGIEAHNLDVSVNYLMEGYKCVNWLTIIGEKFRQSHPKAIENAQNCAFAYHETQYATLFQAQDTISFGDRNRKEVLYGYEALAKALLPIQITHHAPFGGELWNEDNTIAWIRRFTHPDELL